MTEIKTEHKHKFKAFSLIKKIFKKMFKILHFIIKHFTALLIKTLFFAMLFFMVLGAAGWFFFIKYVNEDAVSMLLSKKLQEVFDRPVVMGKVDLKFFNSIQIEGLRILGGEVAPEQDFFSAGKVTIRYNPLPILKQQLVIEEVSIEEPKVFIIVDPDGRNNVPQIRLSSSEPSVKDASAQQKVPGGTLKIAGRDFSLKIKDWSLERGLVTFNNRQTNVSHTVYDVNTRFDELNFDALSPFKLSFVLRNSYKDKIMETVLRGSGRVNLAGFKWHKFAVRSLNMDVLYFKTPIKITADFDNLRTPFISCTAKLPAVTEADLSLFTDELKGINVPASTIKASAVLKKKYQYLSLDKFNLIADDLNITAKATATFDKPFSADFSVKAVPFTLDTKSKMYAPLAKYNLKGKASVETKGAYKEGKLSFSGTSGELTDFSLKQGTIFIQSVSGPFKVKDMAVEKGKFTFSDIDGTLNNSSAKIGNFNIQNVTADVKINKWYSDMSANIKTGGLKLGDTQFTEVKGTASFKKNTLSADVKSAKVNGIPIKLDTDILNFNSDKRRQINSKFYFETLDPMGVVDIVYDFVVAITNKKTFKQEYEGDMAWLRNFRAGLPWFMPNFKGVIIADNFKSSVASGTNFNAEFDLKNMVSGMKKLNGKIDARMEKGTIYQLEKKAAEEKVLGVAFQPFIIMHRMEKAGSFKVGTVLRDVQYDVVYASTDFENGNMNIVNAYMDGKTMGVKAAGWVDWVFETMDLTIWTIFRNASRSGALAENLTDASGVPALSFRIKNTMDKPGVEMLKARKASEEIKKAKEYPSRTNFTQGVAFKNEK